MERFRLNLFLFRILRHNAVGGGYIIKESWSHPPSVPSLYLFCVKTNHGANRLTVSRNRSDFTTGLLENNPHKHGRKKIGKKIRESSNKFNHPQFNGTSHRGRAAFYLLQQLGCVTGPLETGSGFYYSPNERKFFKRKIVDLSKPILAI